MDQKIGSLTKANKLIFPSKDDLKSIPIFTLNQWHEAKEPARKTSDRLKYRLSPTRRRARQLLVKTQASLVNFLFRWMLLDESSNELNDVKFEAQVSGIASVPKREKKVNRLTLILSGVEKLPNKNIKTIGKYALYRWYTRANVIELILIIFLICCLGSQIYLLLSDYFSYPTYVTIKKGLNDDIWRNLPSFTLCNNNRNSLKTISERFPFLNETHFKAITLGTFYSIDNFTLQSSGTTSVNFVPDTNIILDSDDSSSDFVNPHELESLLERTDIDWVKVTRFLSGQRIAGLDRIFPSYDMIESIDCANIWGVYMPCRDFPRIKSFQTVRRCTTLFHNSVFWDKEHSAYKALKLATDREPDGIMMGLDQIHDHNDLHLLDLHDLTDDDEEEEDELFRLFGEVDEQERIRASQVRYHMHNREVVRLRIDFQTEDYANKRSQMGAIFSIHSSYEIESMFHTVYNLEPGYWYTYYIERIDYERLPPPYTTMCYDYLANRRTEFEMEQWNRKNRERVMLLAGEQAKNPNKLNEEYGAILRKRSLSSVSK